MKIERFEDVVSPPCHARPENIWKEQVIRLRQNTLQLAVGMNGGANAPKLDSEGGLASANSDLIPRSLSEQSGDPACGAAGSFITIRFALS